MSAELSSEQIQADIDAFLASGGEIQVLPTMIGVPESKVSLAESIERRKRRDWNQKHIATARRCAL